MTNTKRVNLYDFIDLVTILEPKKITSDFKKYNRVLEVVTETNKNIKSVINVVYYFNENNNEYNFIHAVIYNDGNIKYVACY